jgi:hypothetical protein
MGLATEQIIRYTGRKWDRTTYTDLFSLPGMPRTMKFYTSVLPVVADSFTAKRLTNMVDAGSVTLNAVSLERGVFDYAWYGSIYGSNTIAMTYTGGLALLEVHDMGAGWEVYDSPSDLITACAMQASYNLNNFLGNKSNSEDKPAQRPPKVIMPEVARILDPYVRPKYFGA